MNTVTKEVTKEQAVKAALNSPELSDVSFVLGDREFKVIDLSYDDYLKFVTFLSPMVEVLLGTISVGGVSVTKSSNISAGDIIKHCSQSLPELACIVCRQTDESVTIEDVKRWCVSGTPKGPFKLAEIALKQIEKNGIISDFASFFVQTLPILKSALSLPL